MPQRYRPDTSLYGVLVKRSFRPWKWRLLLSAGRTSDQENKASPLAQKGRKLIYGKGEEDEKRLELRGAYGVGKRFILVN